MRLTERVAGDYLIEIDPTELDQVIAPEYVEIMRHKMELQMKWRDALTDAKIDLYTGEFLSIDRIADKFEGAVFWDIGCSLGMWSIAALTCGARKVYGFDPLVENKVPDDDRFTRFETKIGLEPSVDFIATTTLAKPSIIKIDVEGEELDVLKGAEHVIKKYKPILIVEAHEIMYSNLPDKRYVTDNKQKVQDLLRPWIGEPVEVLDQNVKELGCIYHIIYNPT